MSTSQGTHDGTIPSRDSWPEPVPHTEAGAALTDVVLTTIRLNARFLEAAQAAVGAPLGQPDRS